MESKLPLIVANGEIPSPELIKRIDYSQLICSDGAANTIFEYGLSPDLVIGDLDSINSDLKSNLETHHDSSQYATDLEKTFDYLVTQDHKKVLLTGIKGKRFDHSISNLSIISKYSKELLFIIIDDDGIGIVLNSDHKSDFAFKTNLNTVVSLIPLPEAKQVKTHGLNYALDLEDLRLGQREGQSNYVVEEDIKISFEDGVLLSYFNFQNIDGETIKSFVCDSL